VLLEWPGQGEAMVVWLPGLEAAMVAPWLGLQEDMLLERVVQQVTAALLHRARSALRVALAVEVAQAAGRCLMLVVARGSISRKQLINTWGVAEISTLCGREEISLASSRAAASLVCCC